MTEKLNRVLALVLTIAALVTGQTAWAESSWEVTNSNGNSNTFTITRSDGTYAQKVRFRTVNLSAYAGQNYTAVDMEFTFNKNITSTTVTVSEQALSNAYGYYNGSTDRKYRFEVTDRGGFLLASADRTMTNGTSVNSSNAFAEKSVTVNSDPITVTDAGFTQAYHAVPMNKYYTAAAAKGYLVSAGAELRMKVELEEAEKEDGYQHIQLLVNQTSQCDNSASKANPGDPDKSLYLASFAHEPGTKNTSYAKVCFPLTSASDGCGEIEPAWNFSPYSNSVGKLYTQKFKSGYRSSDGRLIIAKKSELSSLNYVGVRFDASGDNSDTWYAKNTTAKIQAIDGTNPTKTAVSVSPGRHAKGNTFYVSVAFNEIVSYTGTRKLNTNWGELSYVDGDGTNVLTFSGIIPQDATENLSVSSISGTIKDLANNSLSGGVSASNLCSVDADLIYTLGDFQQQGGNYLITCHDDLRGLAGYVNAGNNCSDLTFLQVTNLSFPYTTNWNTSSSTENNFTAIGKSGDVSYRFMGTYNGQGHTISGIRIYKSGTSDSDQYQGLFGIIREGTIRNVNLADTRITGYNYAGGIVGYSNQGTVEDCTVGDNVCIHAAQSGTKYHGGIVGYSYQSTVQRCISRVTLSVANSSNCTHYGGTAGYVDGGTLRDCLAIDAVIPGVGNSSAIFGDKTHSPALTRNYFRSCTGTAQTSNIFSISLGTNVTINRSPETTLPGTNNKTYNDGAIIGGTEYYISEAAIPLNYSGEVSTGYHVVYSATAGTINGSTLTMPAEDVTVSATVTANHYWVEFNKNGGSGEMLIQGFNYDEAQNLSTNTYTREGYAFTRWNTEADGSGTAYENGQSVSNLTATNGGFVTLYAQWVVPVTYIDENGDEQTCSDYTLITSSDGPVTYNEPSDQDKWYVVMGDVTIKEMLFLHGDPAHLILCDDASLTITMSDNGENCNLRGSNLHIYGQREGTGSLVVQGDDFNGINIGGYSSPITINGGHVNAYKYSELTINGGVVTGNIKVTGYVTINGGIVSVTDTYGIIADGNITLGWTNLSDRITASSYIGNVSIKDGQAFYNGTEYLFGTITDMSKLNGKTLVPAITYIDENGVEQACADYTLITSSDELVTYNAASDQEQWYVVMDYATIKEGLYLGGKPAHLILCDGAYLRIGYDDNGKNGYLDGTDLHIYGQRNGTGVLETPSNGVTVYGIKCKVTINGGRYRGDICATDNVTINGGTHDINIIDFVENSTGVFTMNGGTADVVVLHFRNNTSETVNINGGIFNITNNFNTYSRNCNVTINGGTVNVICDLDSGEEGAIILGWTNPTDRITVTNYYGNISIKDGQAFYNGEEVLIGTITNRSKLDGKTLVPYSTSEIAYIDENGVAQTTPEGVPVLTFTGTETTLGASGKTTWYLVQGNINLQDVVRVSLAGDVNIILADGCSFNGSWYYDLNSYNGHAFTIYAQSTGDDMGQFHVSCEYDIYNGSFNIRGGNIELSCGYSSALFDVSEGGSVSITGGRVKLNSEDRTFESAGGTVTLGCTAPTDYIYFYDGYTDCSMDVRIKTGQILTDGSHIFSGALTHGESGSSYYDEEQEVYRLRYGHTLRPYTGSLLADNDSDKPAGSKNADIISTLADGNTHIVALQNRIFYQDDDWNTLCLPFDVDDFDDTPLYYATVMELDTEGTYDGHQTGFDATNGTLYLYFKEATSIEAGKPYLVKWDYSHDRYYNPVFNDVTIDNSDEALARSTVTSQDGKVSFCGSYAYQSWASENRSILFLGESSQLYWPLAGAHLGAFRACFHLNGITAANISSARWGFGDESTSLREKVIVNSEEFATAPVYDLQGRKVAQPTKKGLYIYGGRKVVVK